MSRLAVNTRSYTIKKRIPNSLENIEVDTGKVDASNELWRLTNPQYLYHHHHREGPGTNLRSCCVTRTLNTAPTAPEIIAIKTKQVREQV